MKHLFLNLFFKRRANRQWQSAGLLILAFQTLGCQSENKFSSLVNSNTCTLDLLLTKNCTVPAGQVVTETLGTSVTTWSNLSSATTVTAPLPEGYYQNQMCLFSDNNLTATNIQMGKTIFGVTGTYVGTYRTSMASHAHRDPATKIIANLADFVSTSSQFSLNSEVSTYAGADFPATGGINYRDIPDMNQDDDGYAGVTCKYATRPSVDCGTSQATIDLRKADCQLNNPTSFSWDGALHCNGGQGLWKLVTRSGANKEVWQDQRTGLLWSSIVGSPNWCRASGNTQQAPLVFSNSFNTAAGTPIVGSGTIGALNSGLNSNVETVTITFTNATTFNVTGTGGAGGCQGGAIVAGGLTVTAGSTATYSDAGECSFTITQGLINFAANDTFTLLNNSNASYSCLPGGPLQLALPVSYCAEAAGLNAPAGDDWLTPNYRAEKGGLGKNSIPSVRWRLPTFGDYKQADINGVRFVLPDMGMNGNIRAIQDTSLGSQGPEWATTIRSGARSSAIIFHSNSGNFASGTRNGTSPIRCVGR